MFAHPARIRNPRHSRSYGVIANGWQVLTTKKEFPLSGAVGAGFAQHLRNKGVALRADALPSGSMFVVYNQLGALTDPAVYWLNGVDVRFELDPDSPREGGVGSRDLARGIESFLDAYDGSVERRGFDTLSAALTYAKASWTGDFSSLQNVEDEPARSFQSSEDEGTPEAGESVSNGAPVTGYYSDSGGYAWYYDAGRDYMEAIAAPKGVFSAPVRFSAANGDKYRKMKGVLTADALTSRAVAISNAKDAGGVELQTTARGAAAPAAAPAGSATPPQEVVERGEEELKGKDDGKKAGRILAGVGSVPTWAWWTVGGLTLAGGGFYLYRLYKQNA